MMRFLLTVVFLLGLYAYSSAQTDTNDIHNTLDKADQYCFSNPDSAIYYGLQGLEAATTSHYATGTQWAHNALGSAYWVKGDYIAALQYFQKIVDYGETNNQPDLTARGYGNIAVVYIDLGDLDPAYEYIHKSLAAYTLHKDTAGIPVAANNLGIVFKEQKNYDSALYYFQKAARYWGYKNDKDWLALAESNLSEVYAAKEDKNNTLRHALKATQYAKDIDNEKSKGHAYISLARAMRLTKHNKEAVFYARKALAVAKPKGIIEIMRDAHEQLYKSFSNQKREANTALYHYEQYTLLKDSMLNTSKLNFINHLKNKVKLEQTDRAIAEQSKQLLLAEQERERNLLIYSLVALGLLLGISILYGLYRRQKLRAKTKTQQLLVEQQAHDLAAINLKNEQLANKELHTELDFKKQELLSYALSMTHKNQILQEIQEQVNTLNREGQEKEVRQIKNNINAAMGSQENWEEFKLRFEQVHHTFFETLKALYPQLSSNDLRMCAFIKLDLSSKQIASLLNIAPSSVDMSKYRLKKKFGLEQDENLSDLINTIHKS